MKTELIIFAGCLCAAVFAAGPAAKAEVLSGLEQDMLHENYPGAITASRTVLDRSLTLSERRRANYLVGVCYLKLGDGKRARDYFEKSLSDKADDITLGCLVGIADSYYLEGQHAKAIERYEYILSKYRRLPNEANINYKLAQSHYRAGDWANAKSLFNKVRSRYSDSFESELSRNILDKGSFYYTVQVGSFGNKANADNLLRTLKRKKYPAFIDVSQDGFETFYRVRVGKFSSLQEAGRYEQRLKQEGLPTKIYP